MNKNVTLIWWLLIFIFAIALCKWLSFIYIIVYVGDQSLDLIDYFWSFYLPIFAALFWLAVSILFLRKLCKKSWKENIYYFVPCVVLIFIWAVIDIRYNNYQFRGHVYTPNGSEYYHKYGTWYFMPYKWIE